MKIFPTNEKTAHIKKTNQNTIIKNKKNNNKKQSTPRIKTSMMI